MVAEALLTRQPGWETRLATLLARELAAPFAWGQHDCATLALAVVEALTGEDLAAGLPRWFSGHSALRSLVSANALSAVDFFSARLPEIEVAAAHRGDLVLPADTSDLLMCPAVLIGAVAVSRNEAGMVYLPRAMAARAFRVGA